MAKPPARAATPPAPATIASPGLAPRFPRIQTYLKAYTQSFPDWQTEHLPPLQRYADGQAGHTPLPARPGLTREFGAACRGLHACALALEWHGVQTALGGGLPGNKAKTPDAKATRTEFEKLVKGGKHVHMQTPPALLADYFDEIGEPDFDQAAAQALDQEIGQAEFAIVRHLLLEGHPRAAIDEAFSACAPQLEARKENKAAAYIADTLKRAEADPQLRKWRAQHQAEKTAAGTYQESVGGDWLLPWQRSVAYHYWSCRMGAHGGSNAYWIYDTVRAATCCLILGWQAWALTLFRQILDGIARGQFEDLDTAKKPHFERRTQYLLLRLIAQWQGWPEPKLPPQAGDEPLLAELLAHWNDTKTDALQPLLLAACDRHTHLALKSKNSPEFANDHSVTYLPFEVLAVLRLRATLGLRNPALDHPLMATPLGTLPAPLPPYGEPLLDAVIAQARKEDPAL